MAADASACYLDCTSRKIESLQELKPGDHIRVYVQYYFHHMLVVEVIDKSHLKVIHKTRDRAVVEEIVSYQPEEIAVLEYKCPFTGETAIGRARERKEQDYSLVWSNCEHFVTEVKTGERQSIQVRTAAMVGVGVALGAAAVAAGAYYLSTRENDKKRRSESERDSDNEQ